MKSHFHDLANPTPAGAGAEAPAHIREYDNAIEGPLSTFAQLSEKIGGDCQEAVGSIKLIGGKCFVLGQTICGDFGTSALFSLECSRANRARSSYVSKYVEANSGCF